MESPQSTESPQSASHGDTSPPPPKVTRVRGVACHNDRERTFEIPKSACGMDTMSTSPCGEETPSTPRGMVQQEPNHEGAGALEDRNDSPVLPDMASAELSPYSPPYLAPEAKTKETREWVFGAWAYMIALYAAFTALVLAGGGIAFQMRPDENAHLPTKLKLFFAPLYKEIYTADKFKYANFINFGIAATELLVRLLLVHSSGPPCVSMIRAVLLTLWAVACGFSFFTYIPTALYAIAAALTFVSAVRREQGKFHVFGASAVARATRRTAGRACCANAQNHTSPATTSMGHKGWPRGESGSSPLRHSPHWWRYQVARGFVARCALFVVWLVLNVGLGWLHYWTTSVVFKATYVQDVRDPTCWIKRGGNAHASHCVRYGDLIITYLPIAKATGLCLDFNCALILVLVAQNFVTKINEWMGRKSSMLVWMPVHKLLLFHKCVGVAIFLLSVVHTLAHYMAQSFLLPLTSYITTLAEMMDYDSSDWVMTSVWISGAILFVLLVISYGSAMGPARRINYSLFFSVHVGCSTAFIILLFWHAKQFIFWGIVPLILYLQDTARRSVSKETSLRLIEVELIDSVLALTFVTPVQYKSGTYCRLRCPTLGKQGNEWHPFTISSAYSSNTLGFHIKVHPGGWTERVRDLMIEVARESTRRKLGKKLVDNETGFRYQFKARDWLSGNEVLGLAPSWNGKPLIVCSAPHAAPAMHHDRFQTIIIAGAGIGLTPVNSVCTEILHYKWRKGINTKVQNMYAAWMCPQDNLHAYRWFMESASNCDLAYKLCDQEKYHYEMHIYVTSAKACDESAPLIIPQATQIKMYDDDDMQHHALRPYNAHDLLCATQAASTSSRDFAEIMNSEDVENSTMWGRTHIWSGRPEWEDLFRRISDRHADPIHGHQVGVFFCGAPNIVDCIRRSAQRFTSKAISFHVFKENF
eukprot:GEMP01006978.1.p1 GENE.GEMP01006978.1~~GEMP01006978.1.p1  ORF type:complete len:928 (+),score=202.77 GEMP01006978.1:261-3044(+)